MKKFFHEFKEFAMRGNVLDMAIGVVIGAAFGKITTSLVNDIIMPLIGLITGGIDLTQWNIVLNKAAVAAGDAAPVSAGGDPGLHHRGLCHVPAGESHEQAGRPEEEG